MNILCLDQFGELGGAQRCLLDLFPGLIGQGWGVHLAAPDDGQLAQRALALHVTVDPIVCGPYSSGSKTLADMARFTAQTPQLAHLIRELVRRYAADLIYVNGPRLLPAAALAAHKGPRVLFHAHSLLGGSARRVAGRSLEAVRAAMVASCRFVALPLLAYSGDRGIRVVYNGVSRMSRPERGPARDELRIGVIGRVSPEKGQADFVRAARLVHAASPECRFVVCGAPLFSNPAAVRYYQDLQALAEGFPVEFTGWKENVEDVLAALDLLVVPSAAVDATPRVILEAFAAGVPVMAFAAGGIPEIVEPGVTGFLVEERSPQSLALAVLDVLDAPQLRRQVAARACAKARGEFSLRRYQAQMVEAVAAAVRTP
ncbi:MAG TPA: glycosyltransferase family 4 protein [Bryobacteraceae bacterium]|nr:glycosyltransferase family 4 protein [Bryobacteraceae bacterium]